MSIINESLSFLQNNKLSGRATLFAANGDRLEFNYDDGVVSGKALIRGNNGDKETCTYVDGVKHGPAVYMWKAGHQGWHLALISLIEFMEEQQEMFGFAFSCALSCFHTV